MLARRTKLEPASPDCGSLAGLVSFRAAAVLAGLMVAVLFCRPSVAADSPGAIQFHKEIQPILTEYCYDCHGGGENKGGMALDQFKSDDDLLGNRELWWNVMKYLRAGIMPPEKKKSRPTEAERLRLEGWIKSAVFGIDPKNPDPGRVTLRRLNRVEYRNTIRDLMGVDFKADDEFPPDDTGYGFDNIGDVLTISPLLLEKYMQAAETIVNEAVPTVSRVVKETIIDGKQFHGAGEMVDDNPAGRNLGIRPVGGERALNLSYYKEAHLSHNVTTEEAGAYRLLLDLSVRGDFDFDPGQCRFSLSVDGQEAWQQEFLWQDRKKYHFEIPEAWQTGEHTLTFDLLPLTPPEKRRTAVDMQIISVAVQGPLDEARWGRPRNFERFFSQDAPTDSAARAKYSREILSRFARKALRHPAKDRILDRLVAIAQEGYQVPGKSFEAGMGRAMVALLASPGFLFRVEGNAAEHSNKASLPVDDYALASRLSYFLWSTMPDDELFQLAEKGGLRENLPQQVKRMLADARAEALIKNFTGQWLQARDVDGIAIDARTVLARDNGVEKELQRQLDEFRAQVANRKAAGTNQARLSGSGTNALLAGVPTAMPDRPRRLKAFPPPAVELDEPLRRAMHQETEMFFGHIVHQDRSVLDLLDSDYTFLNEKLARHYGITNITGVEMRRVTLPKDSPRGGVLSQGSVLAVTSNPTRTSPVKRGLFILDNILGMPAPPPPPDIPALEDSEKAFKDKEPTLREVLELHRSKPLCASCHNRMDPLGLALENFNAMGMWREKERNAPIDAAGKLITGETFHDIRELKQILKEKHATEFYRCLTEKLLTYALGRGLDYYDVGTVDAIVERLQKEDGRFSVLLMGIIESPAFQNRRNTSAVAHANADSKSGTPLAQAKTNP